MDKIYILKKNKLISGPYTLEAVKNRGMSYTDLVWYEGLNDWTPAIELEMFETIIKSKVKKEKTLFEKVFSFLR